MLSRRRLLKMFEQKEVYDEECRVMLDGLQKSRDALARKYDQCLRLENACRKLAEAIYEALNTPHKGRK